MRHCVSIVFKGMGEACPLRDTLERSSMVRLWDMRDANYNPLEVKGGELGVFKQANVKNDIWMLPVLPSRVEIEPDSAEYLTDVEKLISFRTSYQYISLK